MKISPEIKPLDEVSISTSRKVVIVIISALTCFVLGGSWVLLPSLSNILMQKDALGITPTHYSALSFSLLLGALITAIFSGVVGYKKYSKYVLLIGLFIGGISMGIFSLSYLSHRIDCYYTLLVAQFFLGVTISSVLSSLSAYICFIVKGLSYSILPFLYACINFGDFTNLILLNFYDLLDTWWIMSTIISICFFLLFLLVAYFFSKEGSYLLGNRRGVLSAIRKAPPMFWVFLLAVFFYSILEISITVWGVVYLYIGKHFDIENSNYALSFYWTSAAIGQLLVAFFVRWISPKKIYKILPILFAVGFFGLHFTKSQYLGVFFFIVMGLGNSAFLALTMGFVERRFTNIAEIASGLVVESYFLGSALGTIIIGYTYQLLLASLSSVFFGLGCLSILLFIVVRGLMNRLSRV